MSKQARSILEVAYQDALSHVSRFVKEGQEVTWAKGRYKGRQAQVTSVSIDLDGSVYLSVRTRAVRRGQFDPDFIDDNDLFHRTAKYPDDFGIVIP